jgi:hypothetical protein
VRGGWQRRAREETVPVDVLEGRDHRRSINCHCVGQTAPAVRQTLAGGSHRLRAGGMAARIHLIGSAGDW